MADNLKRMDGEGQDQYFYRICNMKDSLGFTWPQMAEIFNNEFGCNKGDTAYRKRWAAFKSVLDANTDKIVGENKYLEELKTEKRNIEKERKKLQTEKLEYNKWLREEARDELICEHICQAIKELPALDIPPLLGYGDNTLVGRDAVLIISDAHYGAEFTIKGLFGEILNEYNPEIFEARMWDLLNQVIKICKKENINTLRVYDLGDSVDGLLRVSQLMKLRYGVIESTIRYGRFMTEWLNELTQHVKVKFQMVTDANHSQLRMIGQPKNTFKDENMSYIIAEKFMDRLGNNPNFEFVQNPSGYVFDELAGYRVLGIHGEVKNMEDAIKNFSTTYKTPIDILIGGHKHHKEVDNVGIRVDAVSVPSIIGVDDYSMSLNKTADAGATMLFVEAGKGISIEYNIKFDI